MTMQYPRLVESKTAAHEVTTVEWNPSMDLLAIVFKNNALTCSRLLSLQKVWHKSSCGRIISIAWRPDGRVLAIGAYNDMTRENICTLHDVEDGKEIYSITFSHEITTIKWLKCSRVDHGDEREDPLRTKKTVPTLDSNIESFSHRLALKQNDLNILMVALQDGIIELHALGLFRLGTLRFSESTSEIITEANMSKCMRYITTTISSNNHSGIRVMKIDTLQSRSKEILNVAKMYAKITDELEYLEDTLSAITTSWTDVLAGLDNKLSSYGSRKARKSDDSEVMGSYTFISADDLLTLLVLGKPSDNLEKFLADMSDKGLRKLNNAIEQTCLRIQNLIVKNAQKCCYHLHNDLNMLRGMSLWRERYGDVGLDDKTIVGAMKDVGSLILKLTELQQVIDNSLKSTKSFFKWLISNACRLTGEQSSGMQNDVNKTTQQDIQLITDFILENFDYNSSQDELFGSLLGEDSSRDSWNNRPTCSNFTLEQVGQYLKNEALTRLKYSFTKQDTNFWIDFFKSRPDICDTRILEEDDSTVLLFYPHRAETSLIQEHKRSCSSIKSAFESVAERFNKLSSISSSFNPYILNLNQSFKNCPVDRLRVETDMKTLQLFALFQTKPNPKSKQYLAVFSLVDRTYRLISIEFQSANPSASTSRQANAMSHTTRQVSSSLYNMQISDACFYENRETKKMLITFLLNDQTLGDTIIAQIEVGRLFDNIECPERDYAQHTKVFRTADSIEIHSSQVLIKLDLSTEPASERKHEPELMMKRIKGVTSLDMFASSSRGVIAFTSSGYKRLHLYELESIVMGPELVDDEVEEGGKIDDSLIDTDLLD